jgi:two-component system, chemotaxis family, CheB/CheR fusion protein
VTDEPVNGAHTHNLENREGNSPEDNPAAPPPFLAVAIGASEGGAKLFARLVNELPADAPLALLFVQQSAHEQQSLTNDRLGRRTTLQVVEARDPMPIRVGHAYIIPADAHMTVEQGQLRLRPRPNGAASVQVDLLFRSLAECYREKAVGVLSGGATDGSAGLGEIKAAGGFTIAQRLADAPSTSIPRAAVAADVVLPAEDIAAELLRLASLSSFVQSPPEIPTDEALYTEIFRLLRRGTPSLL